MDNSKMIQCDVCNSKVLESDWETHIDTDKIKDPANPRTIDIDAIQPLIYITGVKEYRKIGKKIGDAYDCLLFAVSLVDGSY